MSNLIEVASTIFDLTTGESYVATSMEPVEAEPTPEELRASMPIITARQLRLSLLPRLDEVESLIESSQDRALQIEWEYATTFDRLHPAIVSIGAALGLTEDKIDAMWIDASNT